ncbi:peptidase M48 [Thiopseudomonas alkaliphila]|uniref:zinc metalloprotease HtpX n=1 Tax=Thiopseudomonas alkaliphila TaxID=1697053 RepID=UPI00069E6B7F|nr:zinc metalloprotease HtpX [Thiopseudomonas alkaliphila]AKX45333.1 peptidase M48 [Thiopseudomonas alkaliphila]AKX47137.1 peptidase M48 [Thiopseudomonas alkaliphila]AKX48633.1 peptidase M48 [Thiopseudomonas alkaliphila]AKX50971.1 peptidase M48 [Thiopseudomonas alkaliphila]AKX55269.1 peptidase M48 [Thiopseudomonas alkaliphila]
MDFREIIRRNNQRTKLVIVSYMLIMTLVGLLVDTVLNANPYWGLAENLWAFASFQQMPYATLLILALTVLGIIAIHFWGHKMMLTGMNAREISPAAELSRGERQLLNIVEELSLAATLGYIPKLYILATPEPNAFAAGWSSKNAILGVTQGLLDQLNRQEVQAVMAHEVGHIVHGDSKLTLYVGILANVILTITNIFSQLFFVARGERNQAANKARMILMLLNLVLPVITQVLYLYLSRTREYMADAAAVQLTQDNQAMISALRKISGQHQQHQYEHESTGQAYRSAAYIYNKGDSLFSTHPSIENRIAALEGRRPQ